MGGKACDDLGAAWEPPSAQWARWQRPVRFAARLLAVALPSVLASCGGGGSSSPAPVTTTTITPSGSAVHLASLAITPAAATIALIDSSQAFTALGTYSDGTSKDLTASVTWSSSDPTIIQVINDAARNGLATPVSPGSATVTAQLGNITGSTAVSVATDGLSSWTLRQFSANSGQGIAFSGSRYVDLSLQVTSTDGVNWHPIQGARSLVGAPYQAGIAWTGSEFATWGSTSPDGLHWTPHDVSAISNGVSIQRIVSSGSQLVAISGTQGYHVATYSPWSTLFSSADGITWTQHIGPYADPYLGGVLWNGTDFIAAGMGGSVMRSSDGATWTGVNDTNAPLGVTGLAQSPTALVAVGGEKADSSTAVAPIQRSLDGGTTWSVVSPAGWTGSIYFSDVVWNGDQGQFVAFGGSSPSPSGTAGVTATSPDGLTWTLHSNSQTISRAIWSGAQFVAEGVAALQTSPDGVNWTDATSTTPGSASTRAAVATGAQIVATTTADTIIESPDGIAWNTVYTSPTPSGSAAPLSLGCIAWNGSIYVVCSENGFVTSTDGITWTYQASVGATASILLWTGSQFVGFGNDILLASPDGLAWTAVPWAPSTTTQVTSVAWSGSLYVLAGSAGLLTSSDAITWTSAGVPAAVWVTWNGHQFVAADGASPSNVYTSADGAVWVKHALPFTLSGGSTYLGPPYQPSLIWSGSQFFAQACNTNSAAATQACDIFTSADGVSWTVSLSMAYPDVQLTAAVSTPARTVMMMGGASTPMILSQP